MQFFIAAGQLFKLISKVISLFMEKNKVKAEAKKAALDKLTDAAKETDNAKRTSKLNRVLDDVRGL
jgi:hypothetical protein